jgi:hypothetical protein
MSTELIPIIALVVMFLAATVFPVNMGALGFVAAFFVGTIAVGMGTDDIIAGFPSSLFLTLVGITYLFAIAQNNGTVDLLVRGAVRLVGGRVALIPWVMFGITGVLTSIGALGPAAVAIVAPIALGFAARYKINALLMGMMVIHGAQAGGFSPISIYGVTVNNIAQKAGLVNSPLTLFLGSMLFNAAIGALLFMFLGGRALLGRSVHDEDGTRPEGDSGGVGGGGSRTVMRGFGSSTPKPSGQTVTVENAPPLATPGHRRQGHHVRSDPHARRAGLAGVVLTRPRSRCRLRVDDGRRGSRPGVAQGSEGCDQPDQLVDGIAHRWRVDVRRCPAGGRHRRVRR